MVNKCVAHGCKTGYASEKKETSEGEAVNDDSDCNDENISTFHFPTQEKFPELRAKWIRWVNRKDFTDATKTSVICEKHFDEMYISRGKRCRLKMQLNPVPTIYSVESLKRPSVLPTPDPPPRKLPKQRGVHEDEINDFNKFDLLHDFGALGEGHATPGFQTRKDDEQ